MVFSDLERGRDFYRAVLGELGIRLLEDHTQPDSTGWLVWSSGEPESPFFVVAAGRPSFWTASAAAAASPVHLAFRAPSREAVDRSRQQRRSRYLRVVTAAKAGVLQTDALF